MISKPPSDRSSLTTTSGTGAATGGGAAGHGAAGGGGALARGELPIDRLIAIGRDFIESEKIPPEIEAILSNSTKPAEALVKFLKKNSHSPLTLAPEELDFYLGFVAAVASSINQSHRTHTAVSHSIWHRLSHIPRILYNGNIKDIRYLPTTTFSLGIYSDDELYAKARNSIILLDLVHLDDYLRKNAPKEILSGEFNLPHVSELFEFVVNEAHLNVMRIAAENAVNLIRSVGDIPFHQALNATIPYIILIGEGVAQIDWRKPGYNDIPEASRKILKSFKDARNVLCHIGDSKKEKFDADPTSIFRFSGNTANVLEIIENLGFEDLFDIKSILPKKATSEASVSPEHSATGGAAGGAGGPAAPAASSSASSSTVDAVTTEKEDNIQHIFLNAGTLYSYFQIVHMLTLGQLVEIYKYEFDITQDRFKELIGDQGLDATDSSSDATEVDITHKLTEQARSILSTPENAFSLTTYPDTIKIAYGKVPPASIIKLSDDDIAKLDRVDGTLKIEKVPVLAARPLNLLDDDDTPNPKLKSSASICPPEDDSTTEPEVAGVGGFVFDKSEDEEDIDLSPIFGKIYTLSKIVNNLNKANQMFGEDAIMTRRIKLFTESNAMLHQILTGNLARSLNEQLEQPETIRSLLKAGLTHKEIDDLKAYLYENYQFTRGELSHNLLTSIGTKSSMTFGTYYDRTTGSHLFRTHARFKEFVHNPSCDSMELILSPSLDIPILRGGSIRPLLNVESFKSSFKKIQAHSHLFMTTVYHYRPNEGLDRIVCYLHLSRPAHRILRDLEASKVTSQTFKSEELAEPLSLEDFRSLSASLNLDKLMPKYAFNQILILGKLDPSFFPHIPEASDYKMIVHSYATVVPLENPNPPLQLSYSFAIPASLILPCSPSQTER